MEFSLLQLITRYSGEGKLQRLVLVAEKNQSLATQCWNLVESQLTEQAANTGIANTELYKVSREKRGLPVDKSWVAQVESRSSMKLERLQNDLAMAHQNLQRNNVRSILMEIGEINAAKGFASSALKSFYRCREYNSTPEHIIQMCMNIIKVQCCTGSASRSQTYLSKAENSLTPDDTITRAQLQAASGLVSLSSENYKTAAHKFLEVPFCIGQTFSEVIVPEDIATCGTLCALATFSRKELKTLVVSNRSFKNFLELVPNLQRLITSFYQCNYFEFLTFLEEWRPSGELDFFLSAHMNWLMKKIRNRALIQYFAPYLSVSIRTMAEVFHCDVSSLEIELSELIMEGKINARIDSHNKVLLAVQTDKRATTFQQALRVGQEHQQEIAAFMLRANLLKNSFAVDHPERGQAGHAPMAS